MAVVLVLGGCAGSAPSASDTATAEVRTDASCLDVGVLEALGLELDASRAADAAEPAARGLPPADFVADTALVCDRGETLRDSAGRWWAVTATRLEGDLGPLVEVVTRAAPGECGTAVVPQVWLVDAMGAAVLLPADAACEGAATADALDALDVLDRTEHPVALAQPVAASAP